MATLRRHAVLAGLLSGATLLAGDVGICAILQTPHIAADLDKVPMQVRQSLPVSMWRKGSKSKLVDGDARGFEASGRSGDMDLLLCEVGARLSVDLSHALRRKELFEAHAVASLVQNQGDVFPKKIVDFCAGCGLLAAFLVLMDPRRQVRCIDKQQSGLAERLLRSLSRRWPDLASRIVWEEQDVRSPKMQLPTDCFVVSCHACAVLSDDAIYAATKCGACRPLVVLPCCYKKKIRPAEKLGRTWADWPWLENGSVNCLGPAAVNAARLRHLNHLGYSASLQYIDSNITPMNAAIVARYPAIPGNEPPV